MRALLDECLPKRLKQDLTGHEVVTVHEAGWVGKQNGELIRLAESRYDVFLTIDRNLADQHTVGRSHLSVFILRARSNRYHDLRPLIPGLLIALDSIGRGKLVTVGE